MAKFKVIVSDPEAGSSQTVELEEARAIPLVGRRLGETIDGTVVGLGGHKVKITGGSDRDGFPMRPDIHGGVKTRVILSGGVGYHPKRKGARRRKTLRGSIITEEITQINMKIIEKPKSKKPTKPKEAKPKEEREKKKAKPKPAKEVKAEKPAKEVERKEEKPKEVKPITKGAEEVKPKQEQAKGEEQKVAAPEQEREAEPKLEEGKVE